MTRRQREATMPNPVLPLRPTKCIDVNEIRPFRRRRAVGLHRGPPPEAARIVLILPQVIEKATMLSDKWNFVGRRQECAECLPIPIEFRAAKRCQCPLV